MSDKRKKKRQQAPSIVNGEEGNTLFRNSTELCADQKQLGAVQESISEHKEISESQLTVITYNWDISTAHTADNNETDVTFPVRKRLNG